MKSLFLVCALVLGSTSMAATGLRLFDVHNAKFDPSLNLDSEREAQINVDYKNQTVSLYAQHRYWKCSSGEVCMQMLPVPFSTHLKISSIASDSCGVRTVVAETDNRSANGSGGYERIQMIDGSDATCLYLVDVAQEASYVTSYPSSTTGEMKVTSSKMSLKLNARAESLDQL